MKSSDKIKDLYRYLFLKHLEDTSKVVESWPSWKRNPFPERTKLDLPREKK